jgi:hypothetical protein
MIRHELSTGRPAELDQDVPHDRPDTSVRAELMAKLATHREVILDLCKRVDRLETRADGLTPIERVQRRWGHHSPGATKMVSQPAPPAEGEVGEPSDENCWQWYTYCPEEGLEMYSDRNQAQSAAQSIMGSYEVAAHSDGWHEDMESVSWGMLVPVEQAQVVERKTAEPGDEFDEWVKYELRPARWGHQPAPPAEGEGPTRLRNCPTHGQQPPWAWGCPECVRQLREDLAALQQRHPKPVPVSERPWNREGWCDAEGRCWLLTLEDGYPQWRLHSIKGVQLRNAMIMVTVDTIPMSFDSFWASHCLPFYALPLPAGEVEE